MKQVAIFNSFPFHYEMFGYVIEYAKNYEYRLDIYTEEKNNLGWLVWYENLYGKLNIFKTNDFSLEKAEQYEVVFLTTDDDPAYIKFQNQSDLIKKTICIDHHSKLRNKYLANHLGTRFFLSRPKLPWVIPSTSFVEMKQKKEMIHSKKIIEIAIIGGDAESDPGVIDNILKNNENVVFHVVSRHPPTYSKEILVNLNLHINLETSKMFDVVSQCQFVLINKVFKSKYTFDSLSGAVSIAFSTGTPLIMPFIMKWAYRLNSPIAYFPFQKIKLPSVNIDKVFDERKKQLTKFQKFIASVLLSKI